MNSWINNVIGFDRYKEKYVILNMLIKLIKKDNYIVLDCYINVKIIFVFFLKCNF